MSKKQTFLLYKLKEGDKIRDSLILVFFGLLEKNYETGKDFVGKYIKIGLQHRDGKWAGFMITKNMDC